MFIKLHVVVYIVSVDIFMKQTFPHTTTAARMQTTTQRNTEKQIYFNKLIRKVKLIYHLIAHMQVYFENLFLLVEFTSPISLGSSYPCCLYNVYYSFSLHSTFHSPDWIKPSEWLGVN